jgi:prolipoprotein diacylglyceryl transferase
MPLFLPSPSQGVWYLGPVPIRGYALSILTGIVVAILFARYRWRKWGGDSGQLENIALISVVVGIVGARVYWIVIEWQRYFGPGGVWYRMFFIWEGGLGIWGGITFGFLTAFLLCRKYGIPFLRLADCVAPAFLIAQGIGRLGNWWNQELYGTPTTLPWGLEIDPRHRVAGYEHYATFHPTFLYEMLWNFSGAAILLALEKKLKLGRGKVFALYIAVYATGRFLVELLRIDPVDVVGGLRVNSWATLAGGLFGLGLFLWLLKFRPGANEVVQPGGVETTHLAETPEG